MSSQDERCVALRARRLSRILIRAYEEGLRQVDLTVPQFTLLKAVNGQEPVSPAEIGRKLDLEKSTLSRTLGKMIARGWLDAYPSEDGGKAIVTTTLGRKTLREALPVWRAVQDRARQQFGTDALEALDELVERARRV